MLETLLGSKSCERVLLFILARDEGYSREIARFFDVDYRPIRTWTDLQVEKTLASSGPRDAVAYIEVLNLFNQQDSRIPFSYTDYVRWGMNTPRPDDADYEEYGDYNELTRYLGRPREVAVGLRVSF